MASFVHDQVEVSVPATSANLGPGYDTLGLALDLRDVVTAVVDADGLTVTVAGEGEGEVPLDDRHLVVRAMATAFEAMGCERPGLRLHCRNAIPHGRGLGSSSAAIVAGLVAARGLVAGGSLLLDDEAVLALAARLEGHPDNVAPALYGGCTIAYRDAAGFRCAPVAVDPRVSTVVFVPSEPVETTVARGLLPSSVPHEDAAANAGRAALLVAALTSGPELLLPATEDRLHQHYREPAMPASLALLGRLRTEGVPAVISGAGPTVLAFVDDTSRDAVRAAAPDGWAVHALAVERAGAILR